MAGLATSSQLYSNEPQTLLQAQYWPKGQLDQEDDPVLDEHILDSSSFDTVLMDNVPRRPSFASTASLLSPRQQSWPDFAYNNDATPTASLNHQASLFPEHVANHFASGGPPPYPSCSSNMAAWSSQANLGSDSSNAPVFNAFNTDLEDVKPEEPFNHEVVPSSQHNPYGGLPRHPAPEYRPDVASAASPQWSTSSSDAVEKIPRSGHVQSPTFNHNAPTLRRDGVRKKNARFDIPDGHNVHTIDILIANADPANEEKIRTLKQEKRLLRNRQAALDSRCRKKHHTEKLEEEKKQFITMIDRLEEDIQSMRVQEQNWLHERQQWHQYTEVLRREKEDLVRQHTLETAELRKKINCLIEEMQRLESMSMSAQPSSAGISAGFPEFEHLTMDNGPFDDFAFIENPIMHTEAKNEALVALSKNEIQTPVKSEDTSAAPGLLLMLLLCGAWVASNTSSATAIIPRMPDDVRVASSAILKNIYKDAGLEPYPPMRPFSSNSVMAQAGTFPSHPNPSPMAALHNDLTAPTQQQEREQLFSLSADQYNHMISDDLFTDDEPEQNAPSGRRKVGDLFAVTRAEKKGPAADFYTRSLMRSEVPANVVRDFARMVAEGRGRNGEPLS